MSSNREKPNSYLNIVADLTFLQNIVCCNNDMNKSSADTPRNSPQSIITLEREDSANNIPIENEEHNK